MSKAIGVRLDFGSIEWHVPGVIAGYDTLCGVDANDPGIGTHGEVEAPPGQKITCGQCATIFAAMRHMALRSAHFDADVLREAESGF